jgi:hypothetical protein
VFLCLTGDRGHCRNAGEERLILRVVSAGIAANWRDSGAWLQLTTQSRHRCGSTMADLRGVEPSICTLTW